MDMDTNTILALCMFFINTVVAIAADKLLNAKRTLKGFRSLFAISLVFSIGVYYFPISFISVFLFGLALMVGFYWNADRQAQARLGGKMHGFYQIEENDPDLAFVREAIYTAFSKEAAENLRQHFEALQVDLPKNEQPECSVEQVQEINLPHPHN